MDGKSAIGQMFYSSAGRFESVKLSKECRRASENADKKYKKLEEQLKKQKEIWQLFKDYENALSDLRIEEAADYYAEGFKFGLLLGVESGTGLN